MLTSVMKCKACGTVFQVDLDRDSNTSCPQCGSSNTASASGASPSKRVITPGTPQDKRVLT